MALQKVASDTAAGPDQITGEVIKKLGEEGQICLAQIFTRIIRGDEDIPMEWSEGRVVALEKKDSTRGLLSTYRPITITAVLYRVFARVINRKIHDWIEGHGILGEMHNGYRRDRRGDDCMFIVTSIIEMTRAEKRGLKATFLDCTKAYDKLEQGLRQGCALSPTLFMLYISRLERRLVESGRGVKMRTSKNIFENKENFNLSGSGVSPELSIQGLVIPTAKSYKYLGITLCNNRNYLSEQEKVWKEKSTKALRQMYAESLWKFNRLERMPSHRWPKAILEAMKTCNIFSEAYKRMKHLSRLYECEFDEPQHVESEERHWRAFRNDVSDRIRTFTDREWRENMETKPSLKRYRQHKMNRGTIDHVYDNTRGSTLLAGARAGFLNTNSFRARSPVGPQQSSLLSQNNGSDVTKIKKEINVHLVEDLMRLTELFESYEKVAPPKAKGSFGQLVRLLRGLTSDQSSDSSLLNSVIEISATTMRLKTLAASSQIIRMGLIGFVVVFLESNLRSALATFASSSDGLISSISLTATVVQVLFSRKRLSEEYALRLLKHLCSAAKKNKSWKVIYVLIQLLEKLVPRLDNLKPNVVSLIKEVISQLRALCRIEILSAPSSPISEEVAAANLTSAFRDLVGAISTSGLTSSQQNSLNGIVILLISILLKIITGDSTKLRHLMEGIQVNSNADCNGVLGAVGCIIYELISKAGGGLGEAVVHVAGST
ncbi:uncharacterized protein LOC114828185 [Galendromus occidentalis]|uniref:Uncharacterized protein LOC114828185 n=1 Tax=Galendromus occidentalis TaxID=34638 RepID=A0AAJ7SE38_9ACAR|nr:uncharacterized protein LOC114828185 [Galendromus occidentalis]